MEPYVYWFVLALALAGLEMASGTFYMLVFAVSAALAGVVALAGASLPLQITCASILGVLGTLALRRSKLTSPTDPNSQNLDIGQPVRNIAWRDDGTARVHFRGAEWNAEPENDATPRASTLYIKETRGSTLILTDQKP